MNRFTRIFVSVLLLSAYLLSFSVMPTAHAHAVHQGEMTRHVHIQSSDPGAGVAHSPNCIYCLRIQTSAVILTRVLPSGEVMPQWQTLPVPSLTWRSAEHFAHCPGRAPPSRIS